MQLRALSFRAVAHRGLPQRALKSQRMMVTRSQASDPQKEGAATRGSEAIVKREGATYTGTPQRFAIPSGRLGDIAAASVGLVLRLGTGAISYGYRPSVAAADERTYSLVRVAGRQLAEASKVATFKRPAKPIELYEFEGCPFCKKVREVCSVLELDVLFYPCPKNGKTWRPKAISEGGKSQFPYMVDPNTGAKLYESDEIIKYLCNEYGDGEVPLMLRLGPVTAATCGFALLARGGRGSSYRDAKLPDQPLVLWAYEGSPFVKIVREVLNELELPHVVKFCPRGSAKREELFEKVGHFQVPFLEDPNTAVSMFESGDIIDYLEKTYATGSSATATA